MESIPMGPEELRELAKLLESARNVIAAYAQATWDGHSANVYRECGAKADELFTLAQRYEDRYNASLSG